MAAYKIFNDEIYEQGTVFINLDKIMICIENVKKTSKHRLGKEIDREMNSKICLKIAEGKLPVEKMFKKNIYWVRFIFNRKTCYGLYNQDLSILQSVCCARTFKEKYQG